MQVTVELRRLSEDWTVQVSWNSSEEWVRRSFAARRLDFAPWIGPYPDTADRTGPQDDPAVRELSARVSALGARPLKAGDLENYGRLLFDAVLAPMWGALRNAAPPAGEVIEVAVTVTPEDPPMCSVLWELLHDGTAFLVTHPNLDIAVTRRIPSSAPEPARISAPARVLFAIGADLYDPEVRAGAEFMGLMRELEPTGARISAIVVDRCSPARLSEAVRRHRPDVVQIIAHGHRDSGGTPAVLMRPDDDGPDATAQRVSAEQLYACVSTGPRVPPVMVVAACQSGALSASLGLPLAQNLVGLGIPVVLAMAGSVTDQACRLFTQRFGSVLAGGGSLLQAVTDARLAAYRRSSGPPSSTIDWALPSVFLTDRVPHDYQPVRTPGGAKVSELVQKYDFAEGPVFCGRVELFDLYEQLTGEQPLNALAVYSQGLLGLGKTRIIREFGIRALHDGHVPCVVDLDGQDRPTDPRRFAEVMLWSVIRARRVCGLQPPAHTPALVSLLQGGHSPELRLPSKWRDWRLKVGEVLAQTRARDEPLDLDLLAASITADLLTLIEDARDDDDSHIGPDGRVLVLFDSVDQWGDTAELVTRGLLTTHGLGDEDEPIPVLLAFRAAGGAQDACFAEFIERARSRRWLRAIPIEPFVEGKEEDLAYRWTLLNANPRVAPPVSEQVYAVVKNDGQWRNVFRLVTDRLPGNLASLKFYGAVQVLLELDELVAGDDTEALAALFGSRS
ncbi:CHAT domain-containing protein [Plantactinospora sp. KBS50]|uniref:CHAT domain-containing protein n=1 Tax=Plantactinospora sp. KBS50 TaxID=2024580 RepID=UPI0012FE67DC|nr:CHAT domain-containing protein [Plantactinospora sp. KBS50]